MYRKPLANNIVRVWGYKDGKRTHIDIEAEMVRVSKDRKRFYKGNVDVKYNTYPEYFVNQCCNEKLLDYATSIDMYCGMFDRRFKHKVV